MKKVKGWIPKIKPEPELFPFLGAYYFNGWTVRRLAPIYGSSFQNVHQRLRRWEGWVNGLSIKERAKLREIAEKKGFTPSSRIGKPPRLKA